MPGMGGARNNIGDTSVSRLPNSIQISNGDEAIALLGEPRLAVKKAYITMREPNADIEVIQTQWGPQEAKSGTHYVAKDAAGEYPYDIEAFNKNMEAVPGQPGYFRKATPSRLIEIPEGITVTCVTIDQGSQKPMVGTHPDFIGIGAKNEVYPVTRKTFESDFEWKAIETSPEIVAEVTVSTASAIVCSKDDPYRILVADSEKHSKPVIPGGKVELDDMNSDAETPGLNCVLREVTEEIGADLLNPRYIGKAEDPDRDIRLVPAKKVSAAVVEPKLPVDIDSDAIVKAHYGCPDYIFVGEVDEQALQSDTEELKGLRFIDIRDIGPGDLSAGHDVIVMTYRKMLDQGLTQLPEGSLRQFESERAAAIMPCNNVIPNNDDSIYDFTLRPLTNDTSSLRIVMSTRRLSNEVTFNPTANGLYEIGNLVLGVYPRKLKPNGRVVVDFTLFDKLPPSPALRYAPYGIYQFDWHNCKHLVAVGRTGAQGHFVSEIRADSSTIHIVLTPLTAMDNEVLSRLNDPESLATLAHGATPLDEKCGMRLVDRIYDNSGIDFPGFEEVEEEKEDPDNLPKGTNVGLSNNLSRFLINFGDISQSRPSFDYSCALVECRVGNLIVSRSIVPVAQSKYEQFGEIYTSDIQPASITYCDFYYAPISRSMIELMNPIQLSELLECTVNTISLPQCLYNPETLSGVQRLASELLELYNKLS